jgi:hypothetical protein
MDFLFADDIAVKRYYLKQYLYKITGSENIDPNSRGGNIDARDLQTDEQFSKVKAAGISNAQLYKQAGNAVTVNVIAALALFILAIDKEVTRNE